MSDGDDEPEDATDGTDPGNGEPETTDAEETETAEPTDESSETGDDEPESGDDEPEAADDEPESDSESGDTGDADTGDTDTGEETADVSVEDFGERLDEVEAAIEEAETEDDLDEIEAEIDDVAADLEAADLPEPEDEDEMDPREELEERLDEVRSALEEARGPYAEDVVDEIETARSTLTDTEWTEQGEGEAIDAVETFLDAAGDALDDEFEVDGDGVEAAADALDEVAETVGDAGLDPDEDEETIAALLEATDELQAGLGDAEEWSDLTVLEQLRAQGFYDRLTSENRKDFPPELNVVRIAERENDPERILLGLEKFGSDFMVENCIDALRRMGAPEAFDAMMDRADKRDRPAIEVLGKIGDERALDTLHDYIEGEDNPPLQKTTLKAIGEIGSEESTQQVADRLVAEDPEVRSQAASALGRIGDTRAIDPLTDVLDDDEADSVRASAAWALVQIDTRRALERAAQHADDRSYIVQNEAEKADEALDADAAAA